jgi:hypothetical protein
MVYCSKCGKENDDNIQYCNNCGNLLTSTQAKDASFEEKVENLAEEVGRAGKKAGEKFEQTVKKFGEATQDLGKRIEKATDRAGTHIDSWYDRNFGIFGPLISSFIGLIVIRLVIEGLKLGADTTPVLAEISKILYNYLLLLFILMLLSSYTSYFSKKWKSFRWFSPITFAIVFVIIFQLVMIILTKISSSEGLTDLETAAYIWAEQSNLIMIFVIILLFGYLVLVAMLAFEKDQRK